MKKTIILLASLGALLTACNDEDKKTKEEIAIEKADTKVERVEQVNEKEIEKVKETAKVEEATSIDEKTDNSEQLTTQNTQPENDPEKIKDATSIIKKYFEGIAAHNIEAVDKVSPSTLEDNKNTVNYFKTADLTIKMGDVKVIDNVSKFSVYQVEVLFDTKTEDVTFDKNVSLYEFTIDNEKQIILQRAILNTEYLD